MKKGFTKLMGLGFLALLAACGTAPAETDAVNENSAEEVQEQPTDGNEQALFSITDFKQVTSNTAPAIDGGILNFALVSDTSFPGVLNHAFFEASPDATIMDFFSGTLLDIDENYMINQEGAATFEISEDGRLFTFTIRDNVYWHDGYPVTAQDWVFVHEVMAHPDYTGFRFGADMLNIVGMEEFRNGEADSIAGLTIIDDRTLQMEFINVSPSLMIGAGGIWAQPLPYHIFKDIPVADMASSPEVRQNPIGFGPFIVTNITPGESVSFVRNENYWRGTPVLDGVNLVTVNPSLISAELANGNIDIAAFPTSQFELHYDMSNVEFLGLVTHRYDFIGFKLGEWVGEWSDGENVMNPDAKMANLDLRLAMWKAVDNQAVGNQLFNGLRWEANTLIPPSHPLFHADHLERPAFDPEGAMAILDAAGFVDADGDGFRDNPDGSELVINFWAMTGDEVQDALVMFYVQSWRNIGLNINLTQQEFNSFYDHISADYEGIDVYLASWSIGTNVDPTGLYGRFAPFNESRFASDNNDRLLGLGISEEAALDPSFREAIMHEWQAYMMEQIPVFPTLFHLEVTAVNNRVTNFAIGAGTGYHLYQVGLTSETADTN